jgi:hypothetical protein
MCAMNTLPAEVACMGARCPTQLTVVIAGEPSTWSMLITARPSWTATFTVSRTVSASRLQTGRLSSERSSILVAPAASCTTP